MRSLRAGSCCCCAYHCCSASCAVACNWGSCASSQLSVLVILAVACGCAQSHSINKPNPLLDPLPVAYFHYAVPRVGRGALGALFPREHCLVDAASVTPDAALRDVIKPAALHDGH